MINELIGDVMDIVNAQKILIAKIGNKEDADNYVSMVSELLDLKNYLDSKFGNYVFNLSDYKEDYHHINLNVYHIEEDGISDIVVKLIVNTNFKHCHLFWIEPYSEGLKFKFYI